jgi:tetratricopeptide (TPR) repeat protein
MSLETSAACQECSTELLSGARFCNVCGTPVKSAAPAQPQPPEAQPAVRETEDAPRPSSNLAWYIAGAALVALIIALLYPRLRGEPARTAPPFAGAPAATGAPAGDPRNIDLASMTPREAADRLFDRVMRSISTGDTAQARTFLPMALGAYERVPELDADARYHLGTLHLLAGDPRAARAQADTMLTATPNHLFGLFVAAKAAQEQGNAQQATTLYQRFLDAYDAEVASKLPEYEAHAPALPQMRTEAQSAIQATS